MRVHEGIDAAAELLNDLNGGLEEIVTMGNQLFSKKTPEEQTSIPGKELRARLDFVMSAREHIHAAAFNLKAANQRPSETNKEVKN